MLITPARKLKHLYSKQGTTTVSSNFLNHDFSLFVILVLMPPVQISKWSTQQMKIKSCAKKMTEMHIYISIKIKHVEIGQRSQMSRIVC
jgi:hypothetical protein